MRKKIGFSLIEVLVSLLLVSCLLFGLNAMQIYALKETNNVYFYGVAVRQINNAAERLSALHDHEGIDQQVDRWNRENQLLLPAGRGTITGAFPDYIVTVYWGNLIQHCTKQRVGLSGCLRQRIQLA